MAIYEEDFYAGLPAVTVNGYGKGKAYYVAARFGADFMADFYGWLGDELGLETAVSSPLPNGVNAQVRQTENEKFIFLMNFNASSQTIQLDTDDHIDVFTGDPVVDEINLPPYGLHILRSTVDKKT